MKIDLRKTRASTAVEAFGDEFLIDDDKKDSFLSNIEIEPKVVIFFLIRLAFCVSGIFVLMHMEKKNINTLNGQKAIINNELSTLQTEQKKIEKDVEGFGHILNTAKEYKNKLGIMQKIADRRLIAVTGLDSIQSVIPEEVWLNQVGLQDRKFTIRGISTTTKQIQNFIEKMESTNLFSSVVLEQAKDTQNKKQRKRKLFVIVSELK